MVPAKLGNSVLLVFGVLTFYANFSCAILKRNEGTGRGSADGGGNFRIKPKMDDAFVARKNSSDASKTAQNGTYQVFRILPKNKDELALLNQVYSTYTELQLDFWKAPTNIGEFVDVMVSPDSLGRTKQFLDERDIDYTVIIDDVQRLIIQREKPPSSNAIFSSTSSNPLLVSFFSKRMKDDPPYTTRNQAKYGFGDYHSYDEILRWLADVERFYPQLARVFTLGTTHEGRPIRGIKIGNPSWSTSKRAVWIDGGMHAREWAAIHTALYFIEQLISLYGVDSKITSYVDSLNFYIVPVANPDGFEYSRSDVTPQTRFWRKNRGQQTCKKDRWRRERCCGGVDLNRNFDFHWGEIGSSGDLCSDIFQGVSAFSEPESRAIREKILSPELNGKLDAFITLHTYSQMWIHPYNHERKSFPEDIFELQTVGKQGVDAIESVYGTKFRFGTGADILYPSSGGSDDWAKAHAKVKFVYLLELRPGEEEWDGFLLDRRQLIPTGRETWEGVKVVIDAVLRRTHLVAQPPPRILAPSLGPSFAPTTQTPTTTKRTTVSTIETTIPQTLFTFSQRPLTLPPAVQTQHFTPSSPTTVERNGEFVEMNRRNGATQQQMVTQEQIERLRAQARKNYEQRLQQAEQRRQLLFWQNHQNRLNSNCADRSQWCVNWLSVAPSICRTSTVYMREECRSTCGFC